MYNVLVVDDEAINLKLIYDTLKDDYNVSTVDSGTAALDYLKTNVTDLILLDIRMPEPNGMEVMKTIKKDERLWNIPVIFMTCISDTETEEICFEMGAMDFIAKPFEPKILKRRVKRTLDVVNYRNSKEIKAAKMTITLTDNCEQETKNGDVTIPVLVNGIKVDLPIKEIHYVEACAGDNTIRTTHREIMTRTTLDEYEKIFGSDFLRTGRSHLVNLNFVSGIQGDILVMQNGKNIKLPRRNRKEVVQVISDRVRSKIVF